MSDHDDELDPDAMFRRVLHDWEEQRGPVAPDLATVRRRIAASPSPIDVPRWSAGRSARLVGALARAQVHVVPWLLVPVVLVTATMAVLAARFFGVDRGASDAVWGFSSMMLLGIAVTVTMALSTARADELSLATPLGPQVVVMARVLVVVVIDSIAGLAASVLAWGWGSTGELSMLIAGWMVPLAAIAGAVTFVAIWSTPWGGVVTGLVLVPLVTPSTVEIGVGMGAVTGRLWEALTPAGLLASGLVLLSGAIASARRAATIHVRSV